MHLAVAVAVAVAVYNLKKYLKFVTKKAKSIANTKALHLV